MYDIQLPSFAEFERYCRRGNLIPVSCPFPYDMDTPASAYLKIRNGSSSFLLESGDVEEMGRNWGRYSFIGGSPRLTVVVRGRRLEIRSGDHETIRETDQPLVEIRRLATLFKPVPITDDIPLSTGALVGYVGYDLFRTWETASGTRTLDEGGLPDALFMLPERLVIFDHLTRRAKVMAFVQVDGQQEEKRSYEDACESLVRTVEALRRPLWSNNRGRVKVSDLQPEMEKADFEAGVVRAKEHIAAGDVIQVVLSQTFSGEVKGEPFSIFEHLRRINPSPYMFHLDLGEIKLIGASPEILVRLRDRKIELRPIAGTRHRSADPQADEMIERELLNDPKERAEHLMLVDLGRNDAGRVASPGSVHVPQFMEVERYSHVMHIVSRVEAKLADDKDAFDCFMSAFPAGTVTGAPKIRAMEIIDELEPSHRGPYAGGVGYFAFNGDMDFCITIRTMSVHNGRLSVRVGAGIVADSSPEGEHEETLRKGAALFKAIEEANKPCS
jgi:anthranilate synthase component 1